jgi:hypothetical protein
MINTRVDFEAWPKIPRAVLGDVVITEKMDGTNACVIIGDGEILGVQSRKRMLNVGKESDNYGFAQHVFDNQDKFLALGEGKHYGEWAGLGIQGNPHCIHNKRFFLFNTRRWGDHNLPPEGIYVVPMLYQGEYSAPIIDKVMNALKTHSEANGYKAEGCVVYFPRLDSMEKHTFEYSKGKWLGDNA